MSSKWYSGIHHLQRQRSFSVIRAPLLEQIFQKMASLVFFEPERKPLPREFDKSTIIISNFGKAAPLFFHIEQIHAFIFQLKINIFLFIYQIRGLAYMTSFFPPYGLWSLQRYREHPKPSPASVWLVSRGQMCVGQHKCITNNIKITQDTPC